MNVYLESLGCKLNQSEIETLARRFVEAGHRLAASPQAADLCVLNSCAVTHIAARKSRQAVRRLRRANAGARVIVTGCYAEVAPQELDADLVVGNMDKESLVERVLGGDYREPSRLSTLAPALPQSRSRAFVKIQDGCDNHCTYCLTRLARGPQRSLPRAQILAEIRARVAAGYQEVVLTGVHVGGYGCDGGRSGADNLWSLVEAILVGTEVRRLRLSSIEPWDMTPQVLHLWRDPRLCRHLHLPLQSGSDEILRRMGRRYTAAEFSRLVEAVRAVEPEMAVTTDIIVGFPGETMDHFAESLAFVERLAFARAHVFPYSARPGTPAASLPDQIPAAEKKARAAHMRAVARRAAMRFQQQFIGRTVEVLWESRHNGHWRGLTDHYVRILVQSDRNLVQQITPVRLLAGADGGLLAELL